MLLVVPNSYDEDGNNAPLSAVVAITGVDGYSGYLGYWFWLLWLLSLGIIIVLHSFAILCVNLLPVLGN